MADINDNAPQEAATPLAAPITAGGQLVQNDSTVVTTENAQALDEAKGTPVHETGS